MELEFSGEIFFWRGPAPYFFVTVPEPECRQIAAASRIVSYGWGVIPVAATIGGTRWTTSLFPKDGRYLVPLKVAVRAAEQLEEGETVGIHLSIDA